MLLRPLSIKSFIESNQELVKREEKKQRAKLNHSNEMDDLLVPVKKKFVSAFAKSGNGKPPVSAFKRKSADDTMEIEAGHVL